MSVERDTTPRAWPFMSPLVDEPAAPSPTPAPTCNCGGWSGDEFASGYCYQCGKAIPE